MERLSRAPQNTGPKFYPDIERCNCHHLVGVYSRTFSPAARATHRISERKATTTEVARRDSHHYVSLQRKDLKWEPLSEVSRKHGASPWLLRGRSASQACTAQRTLTLYEGPWCTKQYLLAIFSIPGLWEGPRGVD